MTAIVGTVIRDRLLQEDISIGKNIYVVKRVYIETDNTVDATDTFTVDLANYGGSTLLGVSGYKHTTDNSVIVTEVHTSAVSGTVVTITVPAGTDDDKRIAVLYYT